MSRERLLLYVLLVTCAVVGSLFAILTPAWQVPDEPAHYNYVRQLVERRRCCPVIEPGDWDQAYLDQIKAARFDSDLLGNLSTIQYENHQPPLYYQMVSFLYGWFDGNLIIMRLFSVLLSVGIVWCTYALSKSVLPDRPGVALGAAAFVAFLPQHVAMMAGVNNDSLSELLIALVLLITVRFLLGQDDDTRKTTLVLLAVALGGLTLLLVGRRVPSSVGIVFLTLVAIGALVPALTKNNGWQTWMLGLLVGLIFSTKATGYFMAGVVLVAILLRYRRPVNAPPMVRRAYWLTLDRRLAYFLIPALLLGGMWWLRNLSTYGVPDFLGLRMHDLVVTDQLRTADTIARIGVGPYLADFVRITFDSFWGQFGWMGLPLQDWMYTVFGVLTLAVIAGLLIDRFLLPRTSETGEPARRKRAVWVVLGLTILLTALMYVYYNSEFLQLQGRYLFPALVPIGLLMALGVDAWRRWLLPKLTWAQWLPLAVFGLLAPFDLYLILRVIRPLLLP